MTRDQLQGLLSQTDNEKIFEVLTSKERKVKLGSNKTITVEECLKQYDPYDHEVNDDTKRENKFIDVPGEEYTDVITKETKQATSLEEVPVNRLQLSRQQQIVLVAAAFLVGDRIKLESSPISDIEKKLYEFIVKIWDDNKLDFKSKEIAKKRMSETHCAELWYDYPDSEYWEGTILEKSSRRPGMIILSESNGDKLYPIWDEYRQLIAFGRKYSVESDFDDGVIEHFDIYTDAQIIYMSRVNRGDWAKDVKRNPYNAIPVIYHHQPRPEWSNVQPLIEREEENFSNLADNNDYFGDPALVAIGEVENLPAKGQSGKLFQVKSSDGTNKGDMKFITPETAAETKKMEFDKLKAEQYELTNTPDISFQTMRELMSNGTSGIALKLLFMAPQMKALDHQESFGECIQRRVNLIKKMLISFADMVLKEGRKLKVTPKFKPFMPVDEVEQTDLLIKMYEAGMISKRTMLEMSALIKDADAELAKIKEEGKENGGKNIEEK